MSLTCTGYGLHMYHLFTVHMGPQQPAKPSAWLYLPASCFSRSTAGSSSSSSSSHHRLKPPLHIAACQLFAAAAAAAICKSCAKCSCLNCSSSSSSSLEDFDADDTSTPQYWLWDRDLAGAVQTPPGVVTAAQEDVLAACKVATAAAAPAGTSALTQFKPSLGASGTERQQLRRVLGLPLLPTLAAWLPMQCTEQHLRGQGLRAKHRHLHQIRIVPRLAALEASLSARQQQQQQMHGLQDHSGNPRHCRPQWAKQPVQQQQQQQQFACRSS